MMRLHCRCTCIPQFCSAIFLTITCNCSSTFVSNSEGLERVAKTNIDSVPSYKNRRTPTSYQSSFSLSTIKIDSPISIEDKKNFDERVEKLKKRMHSFNKKDIFQISTGAATRIRHLLRDAPMGKNCIRIGIQRKGCSGYVYTMDYAFCDVSSNDASSDHNDEYHRIDKDGVVVLVDSQAIFFLSGTVLDFKSSEVEERFIFENPNAKRHCGCGESFLV